MLLALLKYQLDVSFIKETLFTEISLSDGSPNFFTFASTSNHGLGFFLEFLHLVLRDVSETAERLGIGDASRPAHRRSNGGVITLERR
jgi:hypothetical protein